MNVDGLLDDLAERVADLLAERLEQDAGPPPWLTRDQAADYLGTTPQRISDLVSEGKLRPARDGRRVLFKPRWLDEYVLGGVE